MDPTVLSEAIVARSAGERLARLQGLSETLSAALSEADVAETVSRLIAPAFGASAAGVATVDATGTSLAFVSVNGVLSPALLRWQRMLVTASTPMARCAATRQPVYVETAAEFVRGYPDAARDALGPAGARAALPLIAADRLLGVVGLVFDGDHGFDAGERTYLQALARQCALALERARLFEVARKAAARMAFLAEAGEVLAGSLDIQATVDAVARLAVAHLGQWCLVDLVDEDGRLVRARVLHVDPEQQGLAREIEAVPPLDDGPIARAVRTGRTLHLPVLTDDDWARTSTDPGILRFAQTLRLRSTVVVPMVARGRTLGAVSFNASVPGWYGPDEVALAEDLTRRAALAIDAAMLFSKAERAVRSRDEFLAVASHELRTPLTPLRLHLQTLLRQRRGSTAPGDERLTERLSTALRQTDRLTRLVENLLDVSRVATGRLELLREDVDLGALARDVAERFAAEASQAGCDVEVRAAAGVHGAWDRLRLDQVVTNLLTNALKYGHGRPVVVTVHEDTGRAVLTVRDHGIGIEPADLDRVFGQFERAVSARSYGGLGLGLYIVRQIVEAHRGDIGVVSHPGAGALFTVTLPLATVP